MRLAILILTMTIVIAIGACQSSAWDRSVVSPSLATTSPTPVITAAPVRPLMIGWSLGENLYLSQPELSLGIQLVQLSGEDTIIVYSAVGKNIGDSLSNSKINLVDNKDNHYELRSIVPLAELGDLQVGALLFPPRKEGTAELTLSMQNSQSDVPSAILLAKGEGSREDLTRTSTAFTLFPRGYRDQSEYRISNNGSGLYKGDLVADGLTAQGMTTEQVLHSATTEAVTEPGPTPSIELESQQALELLQGQEFDFDTTVRIENTNSKEVYFVYIVFPESGNIKAALVK